MKVREAYGGANDSEGACVFNLVYFCHAEAASSRDSLLESSQAPSTTMVWVVLANNEDSFLAAVDSNDATVVVDSFLVVGGMVIRPNRP
jgi:hypothetical protein